MAKDRDFAANLRRELLEARAANDRSVRARGRGRTGVYGLYDLSVEMGQTLEAVRRKAGPRTPYLLRDKIDRLLDGEELATPLTIQELVLLDSMLQKLGRQGIASMLADRDWLQSIAVGRNTIFVVGAQVHSYLGRKGDFVVAQDLRAVTHLQRELDRRTVSPVQSDIVYSCVGAGGTSARSPLSALPRTLDPAIFIGSPASNPMTEDACVESLGFQVLRRRTRRKQGPTGSRASLPFWFAWPRSMGISSLFSNAPRSQRLRGSKRVFAFDGKEHAVERDRGTTHGIIILGYVAGRPVVILMGITGSATYACSLAVTTMNSDFPGPGRAIIAHVRANTGTDAQFAGVDKRTVETWDVAEVRTWSSLTRTWL